MKKAISILIAVLIAVSMIVLPAYAGAPAQNEKVFMGTPTKITANGVIDSVWNNATEYMTKPMKYQRDGLQVSFKHLWDADNFYYLVKVMGDKDIIKPDTQERLEGSFYCDKARLLLQTPYEPNFGERYYNTRHNDVSMKILREDPKKATDNPNTPESDPWDTSAQVDNDGWENALKESTNMVIPAVKNNLSIYETNDSEETYYMQVAIPWRDASAASDGTIVGIDVGYDDVMSKELRGYLQGEAVAKDGKYQYSNEASNNLPAFAAARTLVATPVNSYVPQSVNEKVYKGTPSKITNNGIIDPIWNNAGEYDLDGIYAANLSARCREGLNISFKHLWDDTNFYYLVKVTGDKDVTVDGKKLIGSFYSDKTNLVLTTPYDENARNYNGRNNDVSIKIHRQNPKIADPNETSSWVMPSTWGNSSLNNSTNSVIPAITDGLSIYETNDAEQTYYVQVAIPWINTAVAKSGTVVGIDAYYEDTMTKPLVDHLRLDNKTANLYYAKGYGETVDNPSLTVPRTLSDTPVNCVDSGMSILGAQIRTSDPESTEYLQGLRFGTQLDIDRSNKMTINGFQYTVNSYGTLLAPSNKISANGGDLILGGSNAYVIDVKGKNIFNRTDANIVYTAVIINIPKAQKNREITSRGYVNCTDSAGKNVTFYTTQICKRSVQQVIDSMTNP